MEKGKFYRTGGQTTVNYKTDTKSHKFYFYEQDGFIFEYQNIKVGLFYDKSGQFNEWCAIHIDSGMSISYERKKELCIENAKFLIDSTKWNKAIEKSKAMIIDEGFKYPIALNIK